VREQTRSAIANGLDRTHLLRPAARLRESWLTRHAEGPLVCADGLPIPPPRLRLLVDNRSADADHYLRVGRQMFDSICAAAADSGVAVEEMHAALDFGCGCGRVARHWSGLDGAEIYGCDYNPELVSWCEQSLPLMRTIRNELAPPTPYVSGSFDLIYALSVFTHLDERLQGAWIAEFRRLLRPGGLLVLSLLGSQLAGRLAPDERRHFERGELVVQRPRMAGRNLCTVYHPAAYVTGSLLADFEAVRGFDLGAPELPVLQDAYIARRPLGDTRPRSPLGPP
jgi:SAM-dependent methyltransferase